MKVSIAILTFCSLSFILVVILNSLALDKSVTVNNIVKSVVDPDTETLPASYLVPHTARTPAKNQGGRGTCWIFSTMGILEGLYRKNGYEKGFLKEDEYVSFSEQAYGIGLVNYCMSKPTDPYCSGGPLENTSSDGDAFFFYYMRNNVSKYVIPDAVCPYNSTDEGEFDCPDFDKAVKENPLKFTVKGIKTAYTVDSIKRLLYQKKAALTWSHSVLSITYNVPCDDPTNPANSTEECIKCFHKCKESGNGCCSKNTIPGYTQQGVFGTYNEPTKGGGHAMLILGWNDNFRVDTGLPGNRGHSTVGGFIIKNSWDTTTAHSAEYWAQQHSFLDESFICPCEASSQTWLPANATCMAETPDPLACAPKAYKNVLKEWVWGATVLKCNPKTVGDAAKSAKLGWSEGCNPEKRYALAQDPAQSSIPWVTVSAESDGVMRFHIIEWDPRDLSKGADVIVTNETTWYGIENLLTPETVKGNSEHCGVFFLPYETFLESSANYPVYGHDTYGVSYFDVEWDDSSYRVNAKSGYGKELLNNSTRYYKPMKFDGPFDMDA